MAHSVVEEVSVLKDSSRDLEKTQPRARGQSVRSLKHIGKINLVIMCCRCVLEMMLQQSMM